MAKGRAPCCDKSQVKRGPWSPAEDLKLITFIQKYGHDNWRALPRQAGLLRCGKSCRLRWINYLRPDVKRGNFTKEEEETIIKLHDNLGNKWSRIASYLPGRTDNEIKNVWNTYLKKKLAINPSVNKPKEPSAVSSSSSSNGTIVSPGKRQMEDELEHELDEGSVMKKHRVAETNMTPPEKSLDLGKEVETNKEPKEVSSSSISSNIDSTQLNVSIQTGYSTGDPVFDFPGPYGIDDMFQEVNKPDTPTSLLDIPLETDVEYFWSLLGGFEPVQYEKVQMPEFVSSQVTNQADPAAMELEAENQKWFHYLKTELGLEATMDAIQEPSIEAADPPEADDPIKDSYLAFCISPYPVNY